jgi:diketogulonate reductase-like aldo/keto reductase
MMLVCGRAPTHARMQTIDASFQAGIRFIDTAIAYDNHKQIAIVLAELMPKYKLDRKDLFIVRVCLDI